MDKYPDREPIYNSDEEERQSIIEKAAHRGYKANASWWYMPIHKLRATYNFKFGGGHTWTRLSNT